MPTNKNKVTKATEPEQIQEQEINEEVVIDALNQICRSCTILKAFERKYRKYGDYGIGYGVLVSSLSAVEYIFLKRNILTSYRQLENTYAQLLSIENKET